MTENTNDSHGEAFIEPESVEQTLDSVASTKPVAVVAKPRSKAFLIAMILIGVLGASTVAIANTAPQLLEPIANAIPASWFPENDLVEKSFSTSCST